MNPGITSRSVVLGVVVFLGLAVLAVIVGDAVLIVLDKPTLPTSVETLAATGMGALAGILASTRSTVPTNEQEPPGTTTTTTGPTTTTTSAIDPPVAGDYRTP